MNREGKKCVLYPRVSTEMQVDGYSLEGQKNGLKRFVDREEMEIVGIYEDAGKSGKSIEGRPAFKKMLSDIKNGLEIDYILVYKLSRFGRNAADILNSLEFVQSYGINLICIEEGIDSLQTSGKLLISVLSAVAEIERENIIEQTMNGRREKARQGGWNGGFAPYGYYLKDNQLLIEETEAEAIRIIFDKFANSDIGLGGVAKYLNLQGIKKIPRQNGTLETWSSHFIRLILDNPVYCGKIAWGKSIIYWKSQWIDGMRQCVPSILWMMDLQWFLLARVIKICHRLLRNLASYFLKGRLFMVAIRCLGGWQEM